jgi:hypothetical protein
VNRDDYDYDCEGESLADFWKGVGIFLALGLLLFYALPLALKHL